MIANRPYSATLSAALSTVQDIATYARQGNEPMARSARKTLDDLCCEWADDLGCMSYPAPVRMALRAAGLRETA